MVLSGIPFAMTGGVLALWLRGLPLSISAAIDFISLSAGTVGSCLDDRARRFAELPADGPGDEYRRRDAAAIGRSCYWWQLLLVAVVIGGIFLRLQSI